jgi:hypothetical protein
VVEVDAAFAVATARSPSHTESLQFGSPLGSHVGPQGADQFAPKGSDLLKLGGAEGIRTPDPLHAMEVRYQLRYSPVNRIIWSR